MVHNTTTARMAEVVSGALDESGITNRQAAELTAIPRTTLERKMRTGDFSVAELDAIAQALDLTVAELFARADTPKAAS